MTAQHGLPFVAGFRRSNLRGLQFHPGRNDLRPVAEGVLIPSLDSDAGRELVARGAVDRPAQENQINDILDGVGSLVAGLDAVPNSLGVVAQRPDASLPKSGL